MPSKPVSVRYEDGRPVSVDTVLLSTQHDPEVTQEQLHRDIRKEVIVPALAAGQVVVCDRFYDSTTAYQAFADGLDCAMVRSANALAVGECTPRLTLVYDVSVDEALARRAARAGQDRMELKGDVFQESVAAGFRAIAKLEPERVKLIDASAGVAEVFAQTVACARRAGFALSDADMQAALALEQTEVV
mgnify:CR=1 FL=1